MIILSAAVLAALSAGGFWFYHAQEKTVRAAVEGDLETIKRLKIDQIDLWRKERLADAAVLMERPLLTEDLEMAVNGDPGARRRTLARFRSLNDYYGYDDIFLVDTRGKVLLSLFHHADHVESEHVALMGDAFRLGKPMMSDVHTCPVDRKPHLSVFAPFYKTSGGRKTPKYAVVFHIHSDRFLFPMIQQWPTLSRSAEVYLVRRDGDSLLFLNELRHQKDTALKLRVPLTRSDLPAAMAVQGKTGVVRGKDYRGVEVLASVGAVPDSPWYVVVKIDEKEAMSEWRFRVVLIIALVLATAVIGASLFLLTLHRNAQAYYRTQYLMESALRKGEARLDLALKMSNTGAWDLNLLDHSAHRTPTYDLIFGYKTLLPSWTYEMFLEHVLPEDRPDVDRRFREATAALSDWVFECRIRRSDGEVRWIRGTGGHERDPEGKAVQMSGLVQDITERKHAEERLKRTLADLERSNRELEQFAYVASHDLQEPLRMISSFLQLLEEKEGSRFDKESLEYIAFVTDGAQRMQRLINDLLTYSRIQTRGAPPEPVDLHVVLGEVLVNLHSAIEETGAVVLNGDLPILAADRSQMIQLFQNLIGNALKYHGVEPPRVVLKAVPGEGGWLFSVKDNGIGIDPKYTDKVFQIFQRLHTREQYPGTGIGLPICKRIVERHGGRIWFESQPGEGTTFFFTLSSTASKEA